MSCLPEALPNDKKEEITAHSTLWREILLALNGYNKTEEEYFMLTNPLIETMLNRKSIRKYTDEIPSEEVLQAVVRAGQQAPFAAQLCSLLLTRRKGVPFGAPLLFTICVDLHRMELIMEKRGWKTVTNDLSMLFFGLQDASLMAENMVIAAEGFGMGSCFLGAAPYMADKIAKKYKLPPRVFPLVQLVMGYPAEDPPTRPRYPISFTLFEDEYPKMSDDEIEEAMNQMDEGYLAQGYYRKGKIKIPLEGEREETFTYDNYSWTEHISRKWGQWYESPAELLSQLSKRGFKVVLSEEDESIAE
jgi:nitroreductase